MFSLDLWKANTIGIAASELKIISAVFHCLKSKTYVQISKINYIYWD